MLPEYRPVHPACATPSVHDWEVFREWAAREGWRVPEQELALYRKELADSAFVLRDGDDPLGFVTVCRQQQSAWIGNLLVDAAQRGKGFGRRLFEHAVEVLSVRGVATLWLTASADGRLLYERYGFCEAGRVERWVWSGIGHVRETTDLAGNGRLCALVQADAAAWGDSRAGLLMLLARGGQIFSAGSTLALLQPGESLQVLGPWVSADLCPRSNRTVLNMVLQAFAGTGEIAVDVVGETPVRLLLHAAGFRRTGETVLMMRGEAGTAKLGKVVALASLGSMG